MYALASVANDKCVLHVFVPRDMCQLIQCKLKLPKPIYFLHLHVHCTTVYIKFPDLAFFVSKMITTMMTRELRNCIK